MYRTAVFAPMPSGHESSAAQSLCYSFALENPRETNVTLGQFLGKQFIRVIEWNEPEEGILAYRFPMRDEEIENGGRLTVSESQMAAFVNEGKIADIFGP